MHGPNGSGKTNFVLDCVKVQSQADNTFFVNVDCIEFYSERLLAVCISQHLNTLISRAVKRISGKGKLLPPALRKRFSFRLCKNIDQLYENLRTLNSNVQRTKRQVAVSQLKKLDKDSEDDALVAEQMDKIHFGSLENIFFYLILDNVKALFKIERQKKVIEKLAICQTHVQPTCFSTIVVNDALVQEIKVFGAQTNVFDEYMFSPYYFSPMPRAQIERLMSDTLNEMYLTDELRPHFSIDKSYLDVVFPDFFHLLFQTVSNFTVTVNEYAYLCIFLYPHYMEQVYIENDKW